MHCVKLQHRFRKIVGVAGVLAGICCCPIASQAQSLGLPGVSLPGLPAPPPPTSGGSQASAATATVLGAVTSLVGTGVLTSASVPLGAGMVAGGIPGLLSAEAMQASTMGWTDQVASEASLGNLAMTIGGVNLLADFIMSRALTTSTAGSSGISNIEGLTIAGIPIAVTGAPNQVISLPGLSLILNEQTLSVGGIVVNALHARTLDGLTNVVVGSSAANM